MHDANVEPEGISPQLREFIARRSPETDSPGAGERFRDMLQKVVSVPKEEVERRESEYKKPKRKNSA